MDRMFQRCGVITYSLMLVRHDDKLVKMKLGHASRRISSNVFGWGKGEGNVFISLLATFGDILFNLIDSIR